MLSSREEDAHLAQMLEAFEQHTYQTEFDEEAAAVKEVLDRCKGACLFTETFSVAHD